MLSVEIDGKQKVSNKSRLVEVPKYFDPYHYPEGLDLTECGSREPADKWFRVDASIRKPDDDTEFILPQSLASLPGKLIYFSLGSLGSADVDLMKKLINILSKSPHRFIVSKGPKGDQIQLPSNMWGDNYVNQIAIVKLVDMVITHRGNNTFLNTRNLDEKIVLKTIEETLNDLEMTRKIKEIVRSMRSTKSQEKTFD